MGYKIELLSGWTMHDPQITHEAYAFKVIEGTMKGCKLTDLAYNCSWDALMPVLTKISEHNTVEHTQNPGECRCIIAPLTIEAGVYICKIGVSPLKVAFEAAVAYIEWFNLPNISPESALIL